LEFKREVQISSSVFSFDKVIVFDADDALKRCLCLPTLLRLVEAEPLQVLFDACDADQTDQNDSEGYDKSVNDTMVSFEVQFFSGLVL